MCVCVWGGGLLEVYLSHLFPYSKTIFTCQIHHKAWGGGGNKKNQEATDLNLVFVKEIILLKKAIF